MKVIADREEESFKPIKIEITIESQDELNHFKMIFGNTSPYGIAQEIIKQDKKIIPNDTSISRIISGIYHEIKQYF